MRLNILYILSLIILLSGCTNTQKATGVKTYFDISGFFNSEALRLQKNNVTVIKTVKQNDTEEQKSLTIDNWSNELELFSSSDINKPAWSKSYKISTQPNFVEYTAIDKKLRTHTIKIEKLNNGKVAHIYILNKTDNNLYSTTEELNYYPDSLYAISKKQHVLVLGSNNYHITGLIKK